MNIWEGGKQQRGKPSEALNGNKLRLDGGRYVGDGLVG